MKKKFSGLKKIFKSKIFYSLLIAFVILIPATTIFALSGGFSPIYNRIFPPAETTLTPGKSGVVDTFNSPTNGTEDTNKQTTQPTIPVNSGASNKKSNTPGSCKTVKTIPHKTERVDTSLLYVGETEVRWEGEDGSEYTCTENVLGHTPGVIYTINPITEIIWVGTKPLPPPTPTPLPPPTPTLSKAEDYCRKKGVPGNTSAWEYCIQIYFSTPSLWY